MAGAYDELAEYAERLGFTVEVSDELTGQVNGDCSHMLHRIRVRAGLAPAQSTKTLAHEIAHAILHAGDIESREQAELEAKSTAVTRDLATRFWTECPRFAPGHSRFPPERTLVAVPPTVLPSGPAATS